VLLQGRPHPVAELTQLRGGAVRLLRKPGVLSIQLLRGRVQPLVARLPRCFGYLLAVAHSLLLHGAELPPILRNPLVECIGEKQAYGGDDDRREGEQQVHT
jgi:hypothetical protein